MINCRYKHWAINLSEYGDGWYYIIKYNGFEATYGPFIESESAKESAKLIVDILDGNIHCETHS
jgi:hypothetical protein